ncbi:MAG: 30S ribosome-binding factor RbfA [Acidimicrobiia bacterium]
MARQKSPRMRKVNELVREVIAEAVLDLKDPRIGFLTITGAETSPDLRHAVIYYSVLGTEEEQKDTAEALRRSTPRLQSALGQETRLRYTPKLTFEVDPSIDEGIRISQILTEMADEDGDVQPDEGAHA